MTLDAAIEEFYLLGLHSHAAYQREMQKYPPQTNKWFLQTMRIQAACFYYDIASELTAIRDFLKE